MDGRQESSAFSVVPVGTILMAGRFVLEHVGSFSS